MTARMNWSKVRPPDMRGEARQKMPPIVRRRVYLEQFGRGSQLELYEDNEERSYEAVLTRPGLRVRSGRVPKSCKSEGLRSILRHMGVY